MTESKKGHTFAIQGPTEKKKIRVCLFFVLMLYIKFQVPSSSGSLVLQPTKGVTDRRRDGQTDRPKPICPLNFFEVWGIKKNKKTVDCSMSSCNINAHSLTIIPFAFWI